MAKLGAMIESPRGLGESSSVAVVYTDSLSLPRRELAHVPRPILAGTDGHSGNSSHAQRSGLRNLLNYVAFFPGALPKCCHVVTECSRETP